MKTKLIAALLVATSAAVAAPAFANGYNPAPLDHPEVGTPAPQQGVGARAVTAERAQAKANENAYGGVANGSTQGGARVSGFHNLPAEDFGS